MLTHANTCGSASSLETLFLLVTCPCGGLRGGLHTVYTRVQVERVYKSNPIFEAKNTTFLEKV